MNTNETAYAALASAMTDAPAPVRAPGKKSYALQSSQYERSAGLKRVWIKNAVGEQCMALKTPAQLKSLRARGVNFTTRED